MKQVKATLTFFSLATILILGFQNCSKASFKTALDYGASSLGNGGGPILCDPFSSPGGCDANAQLGGLIGNVFYLPNGPLVDDYINNGAKLQVRIQLSKVDVPTRAWDVGFSLPNGSQLLDDAGQPLIEWFALDLKGFIKLPATIAAGAYQFALESDDGSILDINGTTVINHDGQHSPSFKCASQAVTLPAAAKYPVRLRYYQGPRNQIALRLLWRPWSQSGLPCDESGGLTIVPASVFSQK